MEQPFGAISVAQADLEIPWDKAPLWAIAFVVLAFGLAWLIPHFIAALKAWHESRRADRQQEAEIDEEQEKLKREDERREDRLAISMLRALQRDMAALHKDHLKCREDYAAVTARVLHLESDNERLRKRVAELENRIAKC